MNPFEYSRKLVSINQDVIIEIGVASVHLNENQVVLDSILENHPNYLSNREVPSAGKTFIGNEIVGTKNFTDWDDSYQFHDNLKFLEEKSIKFTSKGKGYQAIKDNFTEENWIAPSAISLEPDTMQQIKKDFIKILKNKIK